MLIALSYKWKGQVYTTGVNICLNRSKAFSQSYDVWQERIKNLRWPVGLTVSLG